MYCLKCGKVNKKDNKKCVNCGVTFNDKNTSKTKPENIKKDVMEVTLKKSNNTKSTTKATKTTNKTTKPVDKKKVSKKEEIKEVPIVEEVLEKIEVVPAEVKEEIKEERKINSGGIRKNIKRDARNRNNSEFCKLGVTYGIFLLVIYGIFAFLTKSFSLIESDTTVVINFLSGLKTILIACVNLYFAVAFMCASLEAVRDKKLSFIEMLKKPFIKKDGKFNRDIINVVLLLIAFGIALYLATALFSIIPFIRVIYFIAIIAFLIYFIPAFVILLYLYIDPKVKTKGIKEMIIQAFEVTKGNRVEFYGTYLSFVGWLLLSILTFGILYYVWLCPYMELTVANLYQKWTKERKFDKPENTGVGNAALIFLTFVGIGLFILVFMISMIISFTLFTMFK